MLASYVIFLCCPFFGSGLLGFLSKMLFNAIVNAEFMPPSELKFVHHNMRYSLNKFYAPIQIGSHPGSPPGNISKPKKSIVFWWHISLIYPIHSFGSHIVFTDVCTPKPLFVILLFFGLYTLIAKKQKISGSVNCLNVVFKSILKKSK